MTDTETRAAARWSGRWPSLVEAAEEAGTPLRADAVHPTVRLRPRGRGDQGQRPRMGALVESQIRAAIEPS